MKIGDLPVVPEGSDLGKELNGFASIKRFADLQVVPRGSDLEKELNAGLDSFILRSSHAKAQPFVEGIAPPGKTPPSVPPEASSRKPGPGASPVPSVPPPDDYRLEPQGYAGRGAAHRTEPPAGRGLETRGVSPERLLEYGDAAKNVFTGLLAPAQSEGKRAPSAVERANQANPNPYEMRGPGHAFMSGLSQSSGGQIASQVAGAPTTPIDYQAKGWGERLMQSVGAIGGDLPVMAAGGAVGGASPVTAFGGAFGLPAAVKKLYAEAREKGEAVGFDGFLDRLGAALPVTAKEWLVGAAGGAAGMGAKALAGKAGAGSLGQGAAAFGAEGAAFPVAGGLVHEGKIPTDLEAYADSYILLGLLKGAFKGGEKLKDGFKATRNAEGGLDVEMEMEKTVEPLTQPLPGRKTMVDPPPHQKTMQGEYDAVPAADTRYKPSSMPGEKVFAAEETAAATPTPEKSAGELAQGEPVPGTDPRAGALTQKPQLGEQPEVERMAMAEPERPEDVFIVNRRTGGNDFSALPDLTTGDGVDLPGQVIHLRQGAHHGGHRGFGIEHIEAEHGEEIRAMGFEDVPDFVDYVTSAPTAKYYQPRTGRVLVVRENGKNKVAVVESRREKVGDFYSVVSAFFEINDNISRDLLEGKLKPLRENPPPGILEANGDNPPAINGHPDKNSPNQEPVSGRARSGFKDNIQPETEGVKMPERPVPVPGINPHEPTSPQTPRRYMMPEGDDIDAPVRIISGDGAETSRFGEVFPSRGEKSGIEVPGAEVVLRQGAHYGEHRGFGVVHIDVEHGNQIRALGFKDIPDFVHYITSGYQQAFYQPGSKRLFLVRSNGNNKLAVIELRREGSNEIYSVVSAFPEEKGWIEDKIQGGHIEPLSRTVPATDSGIARRNPPPNRGSTENLGGETLPPVGDKSGSTTNIPPEDSAVKDVPPETKDMDAAEAENRRWADGVKDSIKYEEAETGETAEPGGKEALDSLVHRVNLHKEPVTERTVSKTEMLQFMERVFNIPIRGRATRHMGENTLGWFERNNQVIRIRAGAHGDIQTVAHEVAHRIDDVIGKSFYAGAGDAGYKAKLARHHQWLIHLAADKEMLKAIHKELAALDYDPKAGRYFEGFAEWMRLYLGGTREAKVRARKFTQFFEETLLPSMMINSKGEIYLRPDKGLDPRYLSKPPYDYPTDYRPFAPVFQELRDLYAAWYRQGAKNRVLSSIDFLYKSPKVINERYWRFRARRTASVALCISCITLGY